MTMRAAILPRFVRDLLASAPHRGGGLNNWFYRIARVLHPYRTTEEIIELLKAATAGEPVKHGEIERAVKRRESATVAEAEYRTARSGNRVGRRPCGPLGNFARPICD